MPEMSGGELVLYPIRKDALQRFLSPGGHLSHGREAKNAHFFETIDMQNFYPEHEFYTKELHFDVTNIYVLHMISKNIYDMIIHTYIIYIYIAPQSHYVPYDHSVTALSYK